MLLAAAGAVAGAGKQSAAGGGAARPTTRPLPSSPLLRRHRPTPTRFAASSSTPQQPPTDDPPQRPLCRRPPSHQARLSDLLKWRAEALEASRRLASLPSSQLGADAPSEGDLSRELGWVLEDAVAGVAAAAGDEDGQQHARRRLLPEDAGWREIAAEIASPGGSGNSGDSGNGAVGVRLRAPLSELKALWRRRLEERAPHQYLIATAHWRDLVLSVGPGVLVPRPETEMMVDLAEAALQRQEEEEEEAATTTPTATPTPSLPPPAWRPWADLGTGSGAIAIALARMLLDRRRRRAKGPIPRPPPAAPAVFAVDRSAAAASYARHNAEVECGLTLGTDLVVLEGSWLSPLRELNVPPRSLGGILSNPPYIPRREMVGLQAEVGGHEPVSALDGGAGEGLDSLREVIGEAGGMLAPGGFLALETAGGEQARMVAGLLQGAREEDDGGRGGSGDSGDDGSRPLWRDVELVDDCYGREGRFVTAYRT